MLDETAGEMYFLKEDNGFVNRGITENNGTATRIGHRPACRATGPISLIFQMLAR